MFEEEGKETLGKFAFASLVSKLENFNRWVGAMHKLLVRCVAVQLVTVHCKVLTEMHDLRDSYSVMQNALIRLIGCAHLARFPWHAALLLN